MLESFFSVLPQYFGYWLRDILILPPVCPCPFTIIAFQLICLLHFYGVLLRFSVYSNSFSFSLFPLFPFFLLYSGFIYFNSLNYLLFAAQFCFFHRHHHQYSLLAVTLFLVFFSSSSSDLFILQYVQCECAKACSNVKPPARPSGGALLLILDAN